MIKEKDVYKEIIKDYNEAMELLHEALKLKDKVIRSLQCQIDDLKDIEPAQLKIIKSGDTWVAEYDGVDYLWVEKSNVYTPDDKDLIDDYIHDGLYKPFAEVDITDEIAKLRPIMTASTHIGTTFKLYGVTENIKNCLLGKWGSRIGEYSVSKFRLATVKDLMEPQ